jgi:hypothetical protein
MENSLACLRPGGIAVHTTEFNLDSNDDTLESRGLSVYRKRDLERFIVTRLLPHGHEILPLKLFPGSDQLDERVANFEKFALVEYSEPMLKLHVGGYAITSLGVVIRKRKASFRTRMQSMFARART